MRILCLLSLLLFSAARGVAARTSGETYAVLIGGLGGDPAYSEKFMSYLNDTRLLLVRHGIPETNVVVLGEQQASEQSFVNRVSTADNIRETFRSLAARVTADDDVYVVLFGHGSYDGMSASLNIPRRDLSSAEYADLIAELGAGRIVFINTASSSGPFAQDLSGPDRIVITATATGTERDATVFPAYFVEALRSPDSDMDKDGSLSVRELFVYAAERTAGSFEETGHLATEHPAIDDDGNGEATRADELESASDGHLAAVTYLRPPAVVGVQNLPLVREREALEREISAVKQRKGLLDEDVYYAELEAIFVRLARLNRQLEESME